MNKYVTLGILAHVDAGKTTLSEALLYTSGAIRALGRVDHRDAFLDTYELERSRGITIFSKQALFDYNGAFYTLLDTPGHSDFSPEMGRTLQVLDAAVLIISAPDKITGQVKLLWKLLDHYQIPVFIFVNKMDQPGCDKSGIMEALKKELSSHCTDFEKSFDDPEFQEELAVCEDELLESFLEGKPVSKADASELIHSRRCFPVIFGSALKLEGVKELMETMGTFIVDYEPTGTVLGGNIDSSNSPGRTAPVGFAARVFKISRDPQGVRLTHIKVVSGSIKVRDIIGDDKIDQIRLYNGDKFTPLQEAAAGMVVAITGLSDTKPGEGLGSLKGSQVSEIVQPILSCSLILPEDTDTLSFYKKLKALEEEEPMLLINYHEGSETIEVQVMGQVQQEILKHLIL